MHIVQNLKQTRKSENALNAKQNAQENAIKILPALIKGPAETRILAPFLMPVPDYIQADWTLACPKYGSTRGRPIVGSVRWVIHQAVIIQRSTRIVVADVVLGQILWGGDRRSWPRNWRQRLVKKLKSVAGKPGHHLVSVEHQESDQKCFECRPSCPLHGASVSHHHLNIEVECEAERVTPESPDSDFSSSFMGALDVYRHEHGNREYDWTPQLSSADEEEYDPEEAKKRKQKQLTLIKSVKRGRLAAVYLPMLLFGASAMVGLRRQQRQLHQAITRELTRQPRKMQSDRPDRGEILIGGIKQNGIDAPNPCPYLAKGERYVGFNGNVSRNREHLHGRGYRITTWMRRAAYLRNDGEAPTRKEARAFLHDLIQLGEIFGFVSGVHFPRKGTWMTLREAIRVIGSAGEKALLGEGRLRIYVQEDFLVKWRQLFAERMGFSIIPDPLRDQTASSETPPSPKDECIAYLIKTGISNAELASQLNVSKSLVSHHLSGKRKWTLSWQNRIAKWIDNRDAGEAKV